MTTPIEHLSESSVTEGAAEGAAGGAARPQPLPEDLDHLGSRIVGLAARVAGATCRWLLLVAEFDRRVGHARWGLPSTAQWLSHSCGITHRTAADHVRVARALAAFPTLAAALGAGTISYSHARAIARLARPGEDRLVGDLLDVAVHGTVGQLETVVRGLRTVDDNAAGTPDAGEYLRHGWASRTSHWQLSTRLDPERGALVDAAVAQVGQAEGLSPTDALVRIAEIALAALRHREAGPPRGLRGDDLVAVRLELTPADLAVPSDPVAYDGNATRSDGSRERGDAGGDPSAGPVDVMRPDTARPDVARPDTARPDTARPDIARPGARIVNGPGLPRRVVERLVCACRIQVTLLDGDRNVLDLGRRRRLVDDRLFRALLIRDRHCSHPGCTSRHKLEAHHVIHWLRGGRTDMINLVLLCSRHHHAHHDGEFSIHRVGSRRRGSFVFRRADGTVLERHVDPSTHVAPGAPPIETEYAHVPDSRIRSKSVGDRLDRAWAVAVLAGRRVGEPTGAASQSAPGRAEAA